MNTQKLLLTLVLSTALATAALAKHSKRDPLQRQVLFTSITSSVDAGTAADLNAHQQAVQAQRSILRDLRRASPQDAQAIVAAKQTLKAHKQALRTTIKTVLEGNPELRDQVAGQRQSMRIERGLTRFAVADDNAFELLVRTATEMQHSQLSANRTTLQAARAEIKAARDAGADRSERREIRKSVRQKFRQQRALVHDILVREPGLKDELVQLAELTDFPLDKRRRNK